MPVQHRSTWGEETVTENGLLKTIAYAKVILKFELLHFPDMLALSSSVLQHIHICESFNSCRLNAQ
jgi:hypothetical protein